MFSNSRTAHTHICSRAGIHKEKLTALEQKDTDMHAGQGNTDSVLIQEDTVGGTDMHTGTGDTDKVLHWDRGH